MDEKEKLADKTAQDQASDAGTKTEESSVDYKAELEKAQKKLEQAGFTIEKLKKEKKEEVDEDDKDEIDVEAIKESAKKEAMKEIEKFKMETSRDTLDDLLSGLSSDADEVALIKHHYENSINKSGFSKTQILADLQNAKLLANKPKYEKMISETVRSAAAQQAQGGGSASGQEKSEENVDLSKDEEAAAQSLSQRYGAKIEDVRKRIIANRSRV
jgi:hypothetical protein